MHTKRDDHQKDKLHHLPGAVAHGLGDALPNINPTPQTRAGAIVLSRVLEATENVSLPQDPLKYINTGILNLAGQVLKGLDTVNTGLHTFNEAKELGADKSEAAIMAAGSASAASKLHHHFEFGILERIPKSVKMLGRIGQHVGASLLVSPVAVPVVELPLDYFKFKKNHSTWVSSIGATAGALGSFVYTLTGLTLIGLTIPETATGIGAPLALAQGAAGCALLTFGGEAGSQISEATVQLLESLPAYYEKTLSAIEKVPALMHSAEEYVSTQMNKLKNNFSVNESQNFIKSMSLEIRNHIGNIKQLYQLKNEDIQPYMMTLCHITGNFLPFKNKNFEFVQHKSHQTFNYVKKESLQQFNQFFNQNDFLSRGLDQMLKRKNLPSEIPSEETRFLRKHFRQIPGASDEVQRQNNELQQGEKIFNRMFKDMERDPLGAANLLATIDVNKKAEEIHEQVEKVQHNLSLLGIMHDAHSIKSEEKLDNLLENTEELDQKLETLIANNNEVRQQLLIVTENIQQQAEHKRIQENKQGLLDAAGFIGALGQHVGNQDLCRMGTVVHAGVTIATSLAALQGPMALASLTPVSAIGVAALSLMSAFANKGPNMNQIMLDAIQSLAQQVEKIRQEMHERFDKIDNKLAQIYLRIIDGFCQILQQNKSIMEILIDIQNFLRDFKIEVRDYFSTVNETLRSIEDHQHVTGRQNKIESIYKSIKKADGVHTVDTAKFKNLYNEFHSEICGLHQSNRLLVGGSANAGHPVKLFELDENNLYAADFNINALYDYLAKNKQEKRPALVNPTIWSWQVMGLMELLKRFYKKEEKPVNMITKAELKDLEQVSAIGNQTLNFSHSLRNQKLLQQLLGEHIQAGHILEQELALFVEKEEKAKTKDLNQQLKKTMEYCTGSDSASIFDEFKEQQIPFDTQASDQWFTAKNYNSHGLFGKSYEGSLAYGSARNIQDKIQAYIQTRQLSVDQKKLAITKEAHKKLTHFESRFHYFAEPNLGDNYPYSFMLPQNPTHPILPLPKNIFFPIPPTLQMAQWLGLGRVEFQYHIEQVEAKHAVADAKNGLKPQNFIIEGVWATEKERHILFTFSIDYDPGIYGYKRIKMATPQTKLDNVAPKTILLHRGGGNLTAHWKANGEVYSKSILATEVKEILAASPEAGDESTDATLIRAIVAKYGCTAKENEALWWGWVGGNYCREGATSISVVYSNTTHEQNTWTHEANLPTCQETQGKRDTLKLNNNKSNKAEFKAHVTEESEFIKQLQQQINAKQMNMRESFYEELNKEIGNNSVSSLGKAFLIYSQSYYMLKSALTLAFGQNTLKLYPEFNYFFDKTALSHRHQILSQLESLGKNDVSLLEKLNQDLQVCETQVTQGLTKLFSDPHADSILALVLKEWQALMEWYKQHSVDESNVCSSKAVEEMQREQLNTYGILVSCFSSALVSCPPEVQLEVMKAMQLQMAKEGIKLIGDGKGSLQFQRDLSTLKSKLPNLGNHSLFKALPIPNTLATDSGLYAALMTKLEDKAHIINPALSSRSNLFSPGTEAAFEYAKIINGYRVEEKQVANGFIQADGGELKKAIVAILNTASVRAAHSADTNAIGGSHWVAMVILPKNYKNLKNKNEKIFLLDSLNPEREFPQAFRDVLIGGGEHKFTAPACEDKNAPLLNYQHTILPAFPNAEFVNLQDFQLQQLGCTDCGWWALDNAIKIFEIGTIAEIIKDYKGPRRADLLRTLYPDLDKEVVQPGIAHSSRS